MIHTKIKNGICVVLYLLIVIICLEIPLVSGASSASEGFRVSAVFEGMASPVITGVNANQAGLTVSWKPVPGAAKYRVLRRDGKKWISVGETKDLQLTDFAIMNNRPYAYTVVCCKSDGPNVSGGGLPAVGIRLDTPVVTAVSLKPIRERRLTIY